MGAWIPLQGEQEKGPPRPVGPDAFPSYADYALGCVFSLSPLSLEAGQRLCSALGVPHSCRRKGGRGGGAENPSHVGPQKGESQPWSPRAWKNHFSLHIP